MSDNANPSADAIRQAQEAANNFDQQQPQGQPQPIQPPQQQQQNYQPQQPMPQQGYQQAPQQNYNPQQGYQQAPQQNYQPQQEHYPPQGQAPAQVPMAMPAGGVPVAAVEPGEPLKFDDMQTGTSDADYFMKVTDSGFQVKFNDDLPFVGADKAKAETLYGVIEAEDVQFLYSLKYEKTDPNSTTGKKAVYEHSLDRRISTQGEPWPVVQQRAKSYQPDFRGDYPSAAFMVTLTEDLEATYPSDKAGQVLLEAGHTLAYSTPTTGWKGFNKFFKKALKEGHVVENEDGTLSGSIPVKLSCIAMSGEGGRSWGILKYEINK